MLLCVAGEWLFSWLSEYIENEYTIHSNVRTLSLQSLKIHLAANKAKWLGTENRKIHFTRPCHVLCIYNFSETSEDVRVMLHLGVCQWHATFCKTICTESYLQKGYQAAKDTIAWKICVALAKCLTNMKVAQNKMAVIKGNGLVVQLAILYFP